MTHLTTWDEDAVLTYFWGAIHDDANPIDVLRQIADVKITRGPEWRYEDTRSGRAGWTLPQKDCFACRSERRLTWHHIIQVQHGGSNDPRNVVPLCEECHAKVHPWLEPPLAEGWTWVGVMVSRVCRKRLRAQQVTRKGDEK